MIEYLGLLALALLSGIVVILFLFLTSVLGPKRPNAAKEMPFECGEKPFSLPQTGITAHFYVVAMLFIIFDVELAFIFPWAVKFKSLGLIGLIEMAVFTFFIVVGYVYALKKKSLGLE